MNWFIASPLILALALPWFRMTTLNDYVAPAIQNQNKKQITLTFDADMTQTMLSDIQSGRVQSYYNKSVIDILEKNKVPATLFVTGLWAQQYPDILKQLSRNSLFEIENHSWDHDAFSVPCFGLHLVPAGFKEQEVTKAQDIILKLTGKRPKYFRFPGGCGTNQDRNVVTNLGLRVVGWNVPSGDAYLTDSNSIIYKVLRGARAQGVVVMHMSGGRAASTGLALQGIIDGLHKAGYTFVKYSDLGK